MENSPEFQNKSNSTILANQVHGFQLPRQEWKTLNRLATGHGWCAEKMFLWNFSDSPACDCGETSQSMSHIINNCLLRRFSGSSSIEWIKNLGFVFVRISIRYQSKCFCNLAMRLNKQQPSKKKVIY